MFRSYYILLLAAALTLCKATDGDWKSWEQDNGDMSQEEEQHVPSESPDYEHESGSKDGHNWGDWEVVTATISGKVTTLTVTSTATPSSVTTTTTTPRMTTTTGTSTSSTPSTTTTTPSSSSTTTTTTTTAPSSSTTTTASSSSTTTTTAASSSTTTTTTAAGATQRFGRYARN